ncbi:MAG: hypothetical protein DRI72_09440 [Bacteroidetes bacterium]|nr:MAG: hypothetical protein DRI72_09440 [Bacteroidota bacterium]RLD73730.1 MAG: hypothetical protein DRI87_03145 [Bacteroidota bacterium]
MKKAILSMSIVFVLSLFSVPVHSQGCVEATSDAGPQLVGYIQPEFGHYFYGKDNNDNARKPSSFYFRRARIGVVGSIPYDVSYYVMAEFSPIYKGYPFLLDAFVSWAPVGKYFKMSFGQFKSPYGLELNTPCYGLYTINRSLASEQLASPYRELQFMLLGAFGKERDIVSYKLTIMNGTGINKMDAYDEDGGNNQKDLAGRVVVAPWEFIKVGGGFRYGLWGKKDADGDAKSRSRYGVDLSFNKWNLRVQGEYLWGKDVGKIAGGGGCGGKDVAADYPAYNKNGYMFMAMYMTPIRLEPVIKYEYYNPDGTDYKFFGKTQDYAMSTITFGINYFLNEWTRIQVNYLYNAEKKTNGVVNEYDNDMLLIQVQAKF